MSEPMKAPITREYAELTFRVPAACADKIRQLVNGFLDLLERRDGGTEEDQFYTVAEVFPEGIRASEVLRGARYREGLTQQQLAAQVGVKVSHISEMERGKRPIGKEMARRLAKALNADYRVFL
jgi:ribosome-binding protein aMBF1 (putative translation factor)